MSIICCVKPCFVVYDAVFSSFLQIEISNGAELTEEFLQDEIHPKKILHRPKFAKPKPPPGRGAKRMTKGEASS